MAGKAAAAAAWGSCSDPTGDRTGTCMLEVCGGFQPKAKAGGVASWSGQAQNAAPAASTSAMGP